MTDRCSGAPAAARRVLMIEYYFPPLGGIASVRALKFASYLPEFGWQATVVCPRDGHHLPDQTLVVDSNRVCRTGFIDFSRMGKRIVAPHHDESQPLRAGSPWTGVRKWVRRWLYIPDGQVGWYPFALRAARRTMLGTRFDAIFSSSFPITSHLVALRLRRSLGVPWVAEFRDPWTDAAFYDSRIRRRLDRRIEASILRHADAVVTVSRHWADLFRSRGARQVFVITNGFDPSDFPAAPVPTEDVVSYVGTYYPHMQDLRTALLALGSLRRRGVLVGYRVRFIGTLPESLQGTLLESGLAEVLECTGFIGHHESMRHLMASRILLLAGPSSAAGIFKGVIPGKTFEYIGAQRPILYVGHPEAELTAMLRNVPGVEIVAPGDTAAAEQAFQRLLNEPRQSVSRDDESFTHRALSRELARVLDRTVASAV